MLQLEHRLQYDSMFQYHEGKIIQAKSNTQEGCPDAPSESWQKHIRHSKDSFSKSPRLLCTGNDSQAVQPRFQGAHQQFYSSFNSFPSFSTPRAFFGSCQFHTRQQVRELYLQGLQCKECKAQAHEHHFVCSVHQCATLKNQQDADHENYLNASTDFIASIDFFLVQS